MDSKKRIYAYDYITLIALVFVVMLHFNRCFEQNNVTGFHYIFFKTVNTSFGQIGVNMFWVLSGAKLAINDLNENATEFYKKRLIRLLPTYYIAWLLFYIYFVLITNQRVWNFGGTPWKLVFTATLTDGFFIEIIPNYFLVGEWFTGPLIIIYGLFPLLSLLYKRHWELSTFILAVIYVVNIKFQLMALGKGAYSITTAIFLFWIGMSIPKVQTTPKKAWGIYFAAFFLIFSFFDFGLKAAFTASLLGILAFLCIYCFSYDAMGMPSWLKFIVSNSYGIYVVHHRVFHILFKAIARDKTLSIFQY